jgi:HD-like signal output (HDOD) protein
MASDLCKVTKMRGRDEAFSCGLLHDIGKLIFLRADAPFYLGLMERAAVEGSLTAIEREVLGFDHAALGAAAAWSWNLPTPVCEMIRNHHHPAEAKSGVAITYLVNIADCFVTAKLAGEEYYEPVDIEAAENLGLRKNDLEAVWEDVSVKLNQMQNEVM